MTSSRTYIISDRGVNIFLGSFIIVIDALYLFALYSIMSDSGTIGSTDKAEILVFGGVVCFWFTALLAYGMATSNTVLQTQPDANANLAARLQQLRDKHEEDRREMQLLHLEEIADLTDEHLEFARQVGLLSSRLPDVMDKINEEISQRPVRSPAIQLIKAFSLGGVIASAAIWLSLKFVDSRNTKH
jgi:hypothetical protein